MQVPESCFECKISQKHYYVMVREDEGLRNKFNNIRKEYRENARISRPKKPIKEIKQDKMSTIRKKSEENTRINDEWRRSQEEQERAIKEAEGFVGVRSCLDL
jgi:hypothetical protein